MACDIAHISGLVAAGLHPSPIGIADVTTSTTHKTLRGPRGGMILCKAEHAAAIDKAVFPGLQGGPHNHTTAAIAVAAHEATTPDFAAYAKRVVDNAKALAEELLSLGFSLVTLVLVVVMALQFDMVEKRLERIEAMIVGVEKRLWMTVFGVVGVILSQAVQSILQYGPK